MSERTLRCGKKIRPYRFFSIAMVLLFSLSSLLIFQAEANTETVTAVANPIDLFGTPGEVKVTFQICSTNVFDSTSKVDFRLGETVYLRLLAEFYRGGDLPLIANNTIFVVSDDAGTAIWNTSVCQFGGGWMLNAGCQYFIVRLTPEKVGNYSAGVLFEETDYPNDFSKVLSFNVLPPSFPSDTVQNDSAAIQLPAFESTNPDESVPVTPVGASASFAVIAMAGAGLPIFFKKRKLTT
jgi:hypothetical protein